MAANSGQISAANVHNKNVAAQGVFHLKLGGKRSSVSEVLKKNQPLNTIVAFPWKNSQDFEAMLVWAITVYSRYLKLQ